MNRIFLILVATLFLVSCESQEEKIQKAVAQELKGTLYDFDSYEPIKTTVDTVSYSPYFDENVQKYITRLFKMGEELEDAKLKYRRACSHAEIWTGNGSYALHEARNTIKERDEAKSNVDNIQSQIKSGFMELYKHINSAKSKDNESVWFVTHRFKCKTRGGDSDFGDDIFVFNQDLTECLFHMPRDEFDEYSRICLSIAGSLMVLY